MSVSIRLQLFDSGRYRSVVTAFERWQETNDPSALAALLQDALHIAPHEQYGERYSERNDEVLRLAEAAREAEGSGDHAPERAYEDAWFLVWVQRPGPRGFSQAEVRDAIRKLELRDASAEDGPDPIELEQGLVELLCIAWDLNRYADLDVAGKIQDHLLDNSEWARDVLLGPTGEELALSPLGSSRAFTREEVIRLHEELARMPEPKDRLVARTLAMIRKLVDLAAANPGLMLVLTLGSW